MGKCYESILDGKNALENYSKVITLIEEQREELSLGERANFFGATPRHFKRTEPYEGMVRTLTNRKDHDNALFFSENLKARLLSEAIVKNNLSEQHILPEALAQEEQQYITHIRGLRKQMEALYKSKAMDNYYDKEKELKSVKIKQNEFISQLRKKYPEYVAVHYPQPIQPTEITLNRNEILIEFEVTDNATIVFILYEGKLETQWRNISRDSLETIVTNYRSYFQGITNESQLLAYKPELGKKLYDVLFGDLLSRVNKGTTLIIVPDEFLGIVPFEALVTELSKKVNFRDCDAAPFLSDVTYLGDTYPIIYTQSATSLTLLRALIKDKIQGKDMVVFADPVFSSGDSRLTTINKKEIDERFINLMGALADWKKMGVKGIRARGDEKDLDEEAYTLFPRLKMTTVLAKNMKSLFGKNAKIFLGTEANEKNLFQTSLIDCQYIVFATHGILENTIPWLHEPALVLSLVGNSEDYDGFQTMTEVMGLKLDAKVVALTACETGIGKHVSGEGVMGMGRAFQYAGAQNVLVSLWPVAESSATELTAAFFKYEKDGKEPKDAIRMARNDIRRKGYEHPYYWASFILFGI